MGITVQDEMNVYDLLLMTGIVCSINKAMVYKQQVPTGIVSSFKVQRQVGMRRVFVIATI